MWCGRFGSIRCGSKGRRRARWGAWLGLTAWALQACTAYVPATPAALRQAARVQVRLASPTPVVLGDVSVNDAVVVRGEWIGADSATVRLSAFAVTSRSGPTYRGQGETVALPRDRVAGVEAERVDGLRTAIFAALIAVALGGVAALLRAGGSGPGQGGPMPVSK